MKLKSILELIVSEREIDLSPTKIPNMDKVLEKYGLLDLLYTADLYYLGEDEQTSRRAIAEMIKIYRKYFK